MEAIRPYSHPLTEFAHSDNAHQDHHQYLCAREVCLAQLADQQELRLSANYLNNERFKRPGLSGVYDMAHSGNARGVLRNEQPLFELG